jgi:hypothetical protein
MARKRKSGFASVLSSLPPDLKLAFSTRPDDIEKEASSHVSASSNMDDLIVQRVHVAQTTNDTGPVIDVQEELADPVDAIESAPPFKKQKISEAVTSATISVQANTKQPSVSTLDEQMRIAAPHYKTQKNVPQHLKKCE